jgi:hypothetical protein
MDLINDVEAEAGRVKRDIRAELPKLMDAIGVNTADEHQVFHATLVWLVGELSKVVQSPATVEEIAKVL